MKTNYLFTVFTPVFNRVKTIDRVYESLCNQTIKDFEWIIIDDGSTDDLYRKKIRKYIEDEKIAIKYFYQENSGKHVAFFEAIKIASSTFFLTLDSDDEYLPNTLEIFKAAWSEIPDNLKSNFCSVTGLCVNQYGETVGTRFPEDIFDSNSIESHYKYRIKGEKCGFSLTKILKNFSFPNDDSTNRQYVGEGVFWNELSKEYKTRYINKIVRIYYIEEKDSLMTFNLSDKNAEGNIFYYSYKLNNDINYFRYAPLYFLYYGVMLAKFSSMKNKKFLDTYKNLAPVISKIIFVIAFPISFLLFRMNFISIIKQLNGFFK